MRDPLGEDRAPISYKALFHYKGVSTHGRLVSLAIRECHLSALAFHSAKSLSNSNMY